jgi:hypothetical protein
LVSVPLVESGSRCNDRVNQRDITLARRFTLIGGSKRRTYVLRVGGYSALNANPVLS